MFVPIILILITMLSTIVVNANLGLKVSSYENDIKINQFQEIISQEKMILNAVNSYCLLNQETCFNDLKLNGTKSFLISDLTPFLPSNTNINKLSGTLYQNITIDYATKKIILSHQINNLDSRKQYFYNYLNKNENTYCINEEAIPCSSDILYKSKNIYENIQKIFIEKEIALLEAKLLEAESYAGEHTDIQAQIDNFILEKNALSLTINNKKITNFTEEI